VIHTPSEIHTVREIERRRMKQMGLAECIRGKRNAYRVSGKNQKEIILKTFA